MCTTSIVEPQCWFTRYTSTILSRSRIPLAPIFFFFCDIPTSYTKRWMRSALWNRQKKSEGVLTSVDKRQSMLKTLLVHYIYFFRQITTFLKVRVVFVFGLQTFYLIDLTKIFQLKVLKPKNKGHPNFYECCDLTKKVHLKNLYQAKRYIIWLVFKKRFIFHTEILMTKLDLKCFIIKRNFWKTYICKGNAIHIYHSKFNHSIFFPYKSLVEGFWKKIWIQNYMFWLHLVQLFPIIALSLIYILVDMSKKR